MDVKFFPKNFGIPLQARESNLRGMKAYPLIASRIFNTPLLIHPAKLDAIIAGLGERILGQEIQLVGAADMPKPQAFVAARGERAKAGYNLVDGVAVIDVGGVLAHKTRADMQTCDLILGYDLLARQMDAALADAGAQAILFNLDTPGGEVAGAFDLADRIYAARGTKPMGAVASDMAASAGYLIGSAAGRLAVSQTGQVGSIGVVMRHVDMSAAAAREGVNVTFIYAGAHKVDGNPFQPLPDTVRADFQANVDKLYGMFVSAVARHRGMDSEAVRATQARMYAGADAVAAGMADLVATPDQMIQDLRARAGVARSSRAGARATHSTRSTSMSEHEQGSGGANANPEARFAQADIDRARAEGHAEGVKAGMSQERERVSAIMGHAEAEGRATLAQTCVSQGLSVDAAAAVLAASPKAAPAAAGSNEFAAHMAATGNPKVAPDGEASEQTGAASAVASMVAMINGAGK